MKTNRIKFSRIFVAWVGLAVIAILPGATAFADETETLGPSTGPTCVFEGTNSYNCSGDRIVSAGAGMIDDNEGTIEFTVPAAATIETALLYWAGFNSSVTTAGDTITFAGVPIQGTLIGGSTELQVN